jgi:HK97 family phage major capsid protein
MKKSLELKETRSSLVETLEGIKNTAEGETRNLNEAEATEVDNTLDKIDALDLEIKRAERMENEMRVAAAVGGASVSTKVDKDKRSYSFQDAMKQAVNGKLEGLVKEMDQEARNETPHQTYRGVAIPHSILNQRAAVTTAASSPLEVQSFTDQLEANLVLASAGANFYSGVADQKFPVVSDITSSWVAEDSGADVAAAGATTSITLSPKKLISVVDLSKEAMTQNAGLEAAIRRNMAANIASTWEKALLATADVTGAPASIYADAAAGATGVTAADFINLEATVLGNDVPLEGSRMAYIFDKDAYSSIRTLLQTTGVAALWNPDTKELNNYYGFFSTNVGNGGAANKAQALFGDFSKVHLAQFGGLDLLYDPYTKSRQGLGTLIATTLVDGDAVQNNLAFATLIEA